MIIQPIVDIPEICARHEIRQAVICPGSRNAPLTLAFARHPDIQTFVIPDERSAGFIALGLAQSSKKPVVLICTSGTAVANLYPSVIEAFYQQVPLLVITADRPPEWTDQQEGQTIRQQNIFQNHVLASYQFPVAFENKDAVWHANRIINEAILKITGEIPGPVHVNVPLREPFYPTDDERFVYPKDLRIIRQLPHKRNLTNEQYGEISEELGDFQRILVVAGQGIRKKELIDSLDKVQKNNSWVILGDVIGNIFSLANAIQKHDLILMKKEHQEVLAPDLLITLGQSVLSKGLKGFLRRAHPQAHWHIGEEADIVDTYKSLTRKINIDPVTFLAALTKHPGRKNKSQEEFHCRWLNAEKTATEVLDNFLNKVDKGEFLAARHVLESLPADCDLHLSNSMPVRYANYLGLRGRSQISVWANRGTSGIDGCTSTAVGHALNSKRLQVLLTGDLAFFYDRNALWHKYLPDNLRIVVLNNHGGGIFGLIDGPNRLPELDEYFVTDQRLNAKNTADDFKMAYFSVHNIAELTGILEKFFDKNAGAAILEIETDAATNHRVFELFKEHCKK
jgi:2-succinyl-5-enolpyruvyl-6-hydroxy-3-cyclohexene-1-carboxylate synthase